MRACLPYRWGLPFVNRVAEFAIDGVAYADLPDRVPIAVNGYIYTYFWKCPSLTRGWVDASPTDAAGRKVQEEDKASTLLAMLPDEVELLGAHLQRL